MVNLRGHRIGLGEVETALSSNADVGAACVLVADRAEGPELVAFITARGEVALGELRHLPPYMLPARVIVVDSLPPGVAGTIDRARLAAIAHDWVRLDQRP